VEKMSENIVGKFRITACPICNRPIHVGQKYAFRNGGYYHSNCVSNGVTEIDQLFIAVFGSPQVKLQWTFHTEVRPLPENRYYTPTKRGMTALAKKISEILVRGDYSDPVVSVRKTGGYNWNPISEGKHIHLPNEWREVGDMLRNMERARQGKSV
jgi:hypothetical protein